MHAIIQRFSSVNNSKITVLAFVNILPGWSPANALIYHFAAIPAKTSSLKLYHGGKLNSISKYNTTRLMSSTAKCI